MNEERGEWVSTTLPAGWNWIPFRSVFEDVTDSARKLPQKDYAESGAIPVVDQGEKFVGGYTNNEALVHTMNPPFIVFGDHTRCVKYIDFPFVQGADGIKALKAKKGIDARYGYYALRAITLPDKGYSRHMRFLRASSFPICSEDEQRRIVAKLDDVLGGSKNAREELDHTPKLIGHYRQSILRKAFAGELTAEWLVKNRVRSNSKDWNLSDLVEKDSPIVYGVIQPGNNVEAGIPLVRVCDLEAGKVHWSSLRNVSKAIHENYSRSSIHNGDVLVSIVGTIGRVAFVKGAPAQANIARAIARVRANKEKALSRWIFYALQTDAIYWKLLSDAREVARKTLNLEQLRDLSLRVPCLEEQQEVVKRIETVTRWLDIVESEQERAARLLDRLEQATLAKAFRGELVAQDQPHSSLASIAAE
jgi:type I restriction enzyme, S subunit